MRATQDDVDLSIHITHESKNDVCRVDKAHLHAESKTESDALSVIERTSFVALRVPRPCYTIRYLKAAA
jgi:hypothetical protein